MHQSDWPSPSKETLLQKHTHSYFYLFSRNLKIQVSGTYNLAIFCHRLTFNVSFESSFHALSTEWIKICIVTFIQA